MTDRQKQDNSQGAGKPTEAINQAERLLAGLKAKLKIIL